MGRGVRIYKWLLLLACSGILLGIQCPPLLTNAFKYGTATWVSGSFSGIAGTQLTDWILTSLIGGSMST